MNTTSCRRRDQSKLAPRISERQKTPEGRQRPGAVIMGSTVDHEDVVIVGAGVAGLATALGLHRRGIRSLVLESSDQLRVTGFALAIWTNAWKALDALEVGHSLRQKHLQLKRVVVTPLTKGKPISDVSLEDIEIRCVNRKLLLEALRNELPTDTVRYCCKVVSIEDSGPFKALHLADGTLLKTKVLIGCDGGNSMVGKWLGFQWPVSSGRSAVRGCVEFEEGHGYEPVFSQFTGNGVRAGFFPCDDKTIYWFMTYITDSQAMDEELRADPLKLRQFILNKLEGLPENFKAIISKTESGCLMLSHLRFRYPWDLLWGNISKGHVCVAGDALHPMTPDLGQGGCAALEDGVILARCLGDALSNDLASNSSEGEGRMIEMALRKYAQERRWRSIELITSAYVAGFVMQSGGKLIGFLRETVLGTSVVGLLRKRADFNCGDLHSAT